jgi:hypothetical protein
MEVKLLKKSKGKSEVHPRTGHGGTEGKEVYSFFNPGARRGWVVNATPSRFTPGKDLLPLYRRLGGPQGRSGRVQKISLPPGFDPRTVQPVASRYTDYAIPAPPYIFVTLLLLLDYSFI